MQDRQALADQKKSGFHQPEGDHITYLELYRAWQRNRFSNAWCYENFIQVRASTSAAAAASAAAVLPAAPAAPAAAVLPAAAAAVLPAGGAAAAAVLLLLLVMLLHLHLSLSFP